jgi:hypothetical protein
MWSFALRGVLARMEIADADVRDWSDSVCSD